MRIRPSGAVFLDRDGTINVGARPGEYITKPDELKLIPGAAEAIRRINTSGRKAIVVTNQRCVALGLLPRAGLEEINTRLAELLNAEAAARLDAVYFCPHDYPQRCACRKPGVKMFLDAQRQFPDISLPDSVMIGDADTDVQAGEAAGMRAVKIGSSGTSLSGAIDLLEFD